MIEVNTIADGRRILGLTQKELAELLGCKKLAVLHWEAGKIRPAKEKWVLDSIWKLLDQQRMDHDKAVEILRSGLLLKTTDEGYPSPDDIRRAIISLETKQQSNTI